MARILICTQDPFLVSAYAPDLASEGHAVRVVAGTGEAVSVVLDRRCDIVVMNLSQPGPDNLRALAVLKQVDPNLPLIVLSDARNADVEIRCAAIGVLHFLAKPVASAKLLSTLRALTSSPTEDQTKKAMHQP